MDQIIIRGKWSNQPSTSLGIVSSALLILPPKPKKNEISAPGPKRAKIQVVSKNFTRLK